MNSKATGKCRTCGKKIYLFYSPLFGIRSKKTPRKFCSIRCYARSLIRPKPAVRPHSPLSSFYRSMDEREKSLERDLAKTDWMRDRP